MFSTQDLKDVSTHFDFGENWKSFLQLVDRERLEHACDSIDNLVGRECVAGASFLDVGSGSGLHSLAALRLGAGRVVSSDIDPLCTKCTRDLIGKFGYFDRSTVINRSVFEMTVDEIGKFGIVYCWGVLSFTGDMWNALDKLCEFVEEDGHLIISIYQKTPFCGFWRWEKGVYTRSPRFIQSAILWAFCALSLIRIVLKGKNPVRHVREYAVGRGMDFVHDRRDWLGGYPYESAHQEEVGQFLKERGFVLQTVLKDEPIFGLLGSRCTEYKFIKKSDLR